MACGGIEGEIEEERTVAVGLDRGNRLLAEKIGQIAAGVKARTAIKLHGVGRRHPQQAVERIAGKRCIDRHVGLIFGGTGHEAKAFVEALQFRAHSLGLAQVPFADVDGVIAAFLEHFGDGHLVGRHAHFGHRWNLAHSVGVIEDRVRPRRRVARDIFRKLVGDGGKFEAEPRRIAAGHQGRARRRAGCIGGIALREIRALGSDGVDVRRRHCATSNTAVVALHGMSLIPRSSATIRTMLGGR